MIDFERIGKRILEQRKYIHRVSQEKMAEDLGMYQADISNLEKAKSGSGITDLSKLDMIAEYFDVPLENLLFGRRQDQMEKYYGARMQLKLSSKKPSKKHISILKKLMGIVEEVQEEKVLSSINVIECGPYIIYMFPEKQVQYGSTYGSQNGENLIFKMHIYVVYQDEVIGCATAYITTLMQHIFEPSFKRMHAFIMRDIFDLSDTLQILNPYWLLSQFPVSQKELDETHEKMYKRMDALRATGEDRIIFYVETAYVQEDCRRKGIFRMMMDVLKRESPTPMIWLSLEPTSGEELSGEYAYHSSYEASELGQINLNASIAEHLGFVIDTKTVSRQAERIGDDGTVEVETIPVRRTAYYLPKEVREVLKKDGALTEHARARKTTLGVEPMAPEYIDVYQGAWKKQGFIMSIKMVYSNETVYAFAWGKDWKSRWLGVSKGNPAPTGEMVETIERYDHLEEAAHSKYYLGLKVAEQLLGAVFFNTIKPEDIDFSLLQRK